MWCWPGPIPVAIAADATGVVADNVREQSRGNPLAAGLVAFGAGLLVGSLAPESRTENRLAHELQRKAQAPVREQLQQSAEEASDRLGGRVTQARDRVVAEGRQAKEEVSSEIGDRADAVREHARDAASDVREDVQDQARKHTGR